MTGIDTGAHCARHRRRLGARACCDRGGARARGAPIVIGWAFDSKGAMAPFDGPALAAATAARQADQCEGRRQRPSAADQDLRHAGQQAGDREGVCPEAARPGREHHVHDVRRRLRRAGRAGDDQPRRASRSPRASAPTRWGRSASARRASSPSASATSRRTKARRWPQYAWKKGWRKAAIATDTVIVYFKNVTAAFQARCKQLGGKIVANETYQIDVRRHERPERRQPARQRQART